MISAEWFGAIGQWAGAIATVGAVWVALWLPRHESAQREEGRKKELYELSEREARLIVVSGIGIEPATEPGEFRQYPHRLQFVFYNYGSQPVFDLYTEAWWPEDALEGPPGTAILQGTVEPGQPKEGGRSPSFGDHLCWVPASRREADPPVKAWRVRWTDIFGNQWCVDQRDQGQPLPYKDGQPPRPSR